MGIPVPNPARALRPLAPAPAPTFTRALGLGLSEGSSPKTLRNFPLGRNLMFSGLGEESSHKLIT